MSALPGLKKVPQLGTSQVLTALIRWLTRDHPDRYALIPECPNAPGFHANRYIDLLTVETWPLRGLERVAYEVKVSRADFLKELKQPSKTDMMLQMAHRAYFVCPAGLITKDEVPLGCGLIYVSNADRAHVKVIVQAPRSEVTSELTPGQWVGVLSAMNKRGPATKAIIKFGAEELDAGQVEERLSAAYSRGFNDGKETVTKHYERAGDPHKLRDRLKELEYSVRTALGLSWHSVIEPTHLRALEKLAGYSVHKIEQERAKAIAVLKAALASLEAAS